jgi:hypothetical protein
VKAGDFVLSISKMPRMTTKLPHATWLKKQAKTLKSSDGREVSIYELKVDHTQTSKLNAWAKHFREHYCMDNLIDRLRRGTGKTRAQYLTDLKFPDASDDFGPATRSGDFAEILVADLLENDYGYWVPRTRYGDKKVRNESSKGTDVIGFRLVNDDPTKPSHQDAVIAVESKAQLTGRKTEARLQDAVDHSRKDWEKFRLGESLNAAKHRLIDLGRDDEADRVERFQDPLGRPYLKKSGAVAVYCSRLYNEAVVGSTDCTEHENKDNLILVVVHGEEIMALVHTLYGTAANEA